MARGVLGLVALPLAPLLLDDHFVVLVLLRPTKEVLLVGGFFVREGTVSLWPVVVAALPLAVLGVWLFYLLGRAYAEEIRSEDGMPGLAGRVLPPRRVKRLCRLLDRKGVRVVVLGRLATFPSTVLAASAGVSGMAPRTFLVADAAGAMLSMVEVLAAGYLLGAAYDDAGPWLTAVGAAALLGLLYVVGRGLRRDGSSDGPGEGA